MANVYVQKRRNETDERLIKRFARKVKREGVLEEYRNRMYYEKPSVKRRKESIRRKTIMKKLRKERG